MKKHLFADLESLEIDGVKVNPPEPFPWYPNELGWMFDVGRTTMRRSPKIKQIQDFLVSETEIVLTSSYP
jgi:hypothetical protein